MGLRELSLEIKLPTLLLLELDYQGMGSRLHGVLSFGVRADLLLAQLHDELKLLALLSMLIPRLLDVLLKFLIVVYQILILHFELGDLIVASLLLNADFF